MDEVRYMISEASKKIDEKDYNLRNWELELELKIERNELGHRYYKESDIELLKAVKHLKGMGYQLKAIKMFLNSLGDLDSLDSQTILKLMDEVNGKMINMWSEEKLMDNNHGTSIVPGEKQMEIKEAQEDKMVQFKAIMNHIISSALKENNTILSQELGCNLSEGVIKEMRYLMRLQEEKEEERYKKFDSTLRDYQRSRMMTAATLEGKGKKKSKFFKKNKVYI